jgi:hypothetical protein
MASEGTFVLADIGGYTSFLSGVGITHAKDITEHLLNRLIKVARRRWKVGNVMGDCVLFYTEAPEAPQETSAGVQSLFKAFQEAQTEVVSGSTCRCGACDRTNELSLKFVVHSGEYDLQKIGGRKELIGQDVVLATRLLKNSVPVREYVIATPRVEGVVKAVGLDAARLSDELEAIGRVEYSYVDLAPVREARAKAMEVFLGWDEARISMSVDIDAAPEVAWEAAKDLEKRAVWQVTIKEMMHIQGTAGEVGEVHSCVHNNGTKIVHLLVALDEEGRRMTERVWVSPEIMKDILTTVHAEELPDGRTRVHFHASFGPRIPVVSQVLGPAWVWLMKRDLRKDMAGLKELCETGGVGS